jgi:hypothetical protein
MYFEIISCVSDTIICQFTSDSYVTDHKPQNRFCNLDITFHHNNLII